MGRFKVGLVVGLAIGYVLGARAGRERYEQIHRAWERLKASPGVQKASERAGSALTTGITRSRVVAMEKIDRMKDMVRERRSSGF